MIEESCCSTYNRQMHFSALITRLQQSVTRKVMLWTLCGMIGRMAVDVVIAARLGKGELTDALIVALTLPLIIDNIGREGLKFSVVPLLVERHGTDPKHYPHLVSALTNFMLVTGLCLSLASLVFAPWLVRVIAPGLSPEAVARSARLLQLATPFVVTVLPATLLSVHLNSLKHFAPAARRGLIVSAIILACAGLGWYGDYFPEWMVAGHLLGGLLFVGLLWHESTRMGCLWTFRAWPRKADFLFLSRATLWPVGGFVVRQGVRVFERLLSSLAMVGGVGVYYFSFRLYSSCQTLVGTSFATTSLPQLADAAQKGDLTLFSRLLASRVKKGLLAGGLAALVILLFATPLTSLIFGWGRFDTAATKTMAEVLFWFGWGLPFSCIVPILLSGLYALRAYRAAFCNMLLSALLNILLAWLLLGPCGIRGLAMAVSCAALFSCINLVMLLRRQNVDLFHSLKGSMS